MTEEEPKDIGVKVVSKERKFWETVKLNCEAQMNDATQSIELFKSNIKLAEEKLEEFKE